MALTTHGDDRIGTLELVTTACQSPAKGSGKSAGHGRLGRGWKARGMGYRRVVLRQGRILVTRDAVLHG